MIFSHLKTENISVKCKLCIIADLKHIKQLVSVSGALNYTQLYYIHLFLFKALLKKLVTCLEQIRLCSFSSSIFFRCTRVTVYPYKRYWLIPHRLLRIYRYKLNIPPSPNIYSYRYIQNLKSFIFENKMLYIVNEIYMILFTKTE